MPAAIELQNIHPKRRNDLIVLCRNNDSHSGEWVVKDPVRLKYFFLDRFQHWLFERLDGLTNLHTVAQQFNQQFQPRRISESQLITFCVRLNRDGLLYENVTGQQLADRQTGRGFRWLNLPAALLAIRMPGWNASALISTATGCLGWLFHPAAIACALVLFVIAALSGVTSIDRILAGLPAIDSFRVRDFGLLLLCISLVKVVHELGHAVCCRLAGSECNEIGMMLLAGSPCLYCNVSDSWMLPEKRKRIAISLSGIYLELILGSIALILWQFAGTEFTRAFCLNIFLVCCVSTVLINGNPLMRYDGYYVLSDLAGIPNLSSRAKDHSHRMFSRIFVATREPLDAGETLIQRWFLTAYYFCSLAYRVLVVGVILFFAWSLLKSLGLQAIAVVMAGMYLLAMVSDFATGATRTIQSRKKQGRWRYVTTGSAILIAAVIVFFAANIQLPSNINSDAVVELETICDCAAPVGGRLEFVAESGTPVREGDVVARLLNPQLERESLELEGRIKLLRLKITNLRSRSAAEPSLRVQLPGLESELESLIESQQQTAARMQQHLITAPCDGIVLPGESRDSRDTRQDNLLRSKSWQGSLVETANRGCEVERGTVICRIADPQRWKITLLIDEQKLDLVQTGQAVRIKTSTDRASTLTGTTGAISTEPVDRSDLNRRLYRAGLQLDQPLVSGFHNAPAKAIIRTGDTTIFGMIRRWVTESFRFEL